MEPTLNPEHPYTGDGKTSRDIYGGKDGKIDHDSRPGGILKMIFRDKAGNRTK
jgi:hypothetical protein